MEVHVHARQSKRLGIVRDRRDDEDTTSVLGQVLGSRKLFLGDSKNKSFIGDTCGAGLELLRSNNELLGAAVEEGNQVVVVACLGVV